MLRNFWRVNHQLVYDLLVSNPRVMNLLVLIRYYRLNKFLLFNPHIYLLMDEFNFGYCRQYESENCQK